MNKVQGGTPKTAKSLCIGCRNATILKGLNFEEVIYCSELPGWSGESKITFPVVECSKFDDKSRPSLNDYYKTGWVIESRNRGPVGFTDGIETKTEITIKPPKKNPWETEPSQE